jgi:hypothetical protein
MWFYTQCRGCSSPHYTITHQKPGKWQFSTQTLQDIACLVKCPILWGLSLCKVLQQYMLSPYFTPCLSCVPPWMFRVCLISSCFRSVMWIHPRKMLPNASSCLCSLNFFSNPHICRCFSTLELREIHHALL